MEDSESAALLSVGAMEDMESGLLTESYHSGGSTNGSKARTTPLFTGGITHDATSAEPIAAGGKTKAGAAYIGAKSLEPRLELSTGGGGSIGTPTDVSRIVSPQTGVVFSTKLGNTALVSSTPTDSSVARDSQAPSEPRNTLNMPVIQIQPGTPDLSMSRADPLMTPIPRTASISSSQAKEKSGWKQESRSGGKSSRHAVTRREAQQSYKLSPQHSKTGGMSGGSSGEDEFNGKEAFAAGDIRPVSMVKSGSRHSLVKTQHQQTKKKKESKHNSGLGVSQHLPAHGEVQHMEQSLLKLLNQFNSGELRAFDSTSYSLEQMESVRDQQETLARKHFELFGSQPDPVHPFLSDQELNTASENLAHLVSSLEKLSQDIGNLSCLDRMVEPGAGSVGPFDTQTDTPSRMGSQSPIAPIVTQPH